MQVYLAPIAGHRTRRITLQSANGKESIVTICRTTSYVGWPVSAASAGSISQNRGAQRMHLGDTGLTNTHSG